jgi:riboflavin biosynthesis pyrimidine reductase
MNDARTDGPTLSPLETLFEAPGLPSAGLPDELARLYGGELGFAAPRLYANFVASVDGVVALRAGGDSGHLISGDSAADRFVMGLLRASADAILVGAGTFRKVPGHRWTAARIHPAAAPHFEALREKLGMRPVPPLVLLTTSGDVDAAAPALEGGFIVTSPAGRARLSGVPSGVRVLVAGSTEERLGGALEMLRAEGLRTVLTEGGPTLVGQLVAAGLLDELFLTTSPRLFGRAEGDGRKSLVAGVTLEGAELELQSLRRHGSHLFLRYAVRK